MTHTCQRSAACRRQSLALIKPRAEARLAVFCQQLERQVLCEQWWEEKPNCRTKMSPWMMLHIWVLIWRSADNHSCK
ncbi:hypothetical protein Y1Q_0011597 [Alligator mississippiensis]|uniref:Uncharacterized protein n=1 Tax=Alligator mississippiensis TaxID=8496 RepID=A0A151M0F4_ALLMI|nr:hypothetical protein Y1Q_0011597 [Alligator mississippiensis]